MLAITSSQIEVLNAQMIDGFAARVDQYMQGAFKPHWHQLDEEDRRRRARQACQRGLGLGIKTDIYLAQFALLYILGGERFLQRPDTNRILLDDSMGWRERLYQLISLAGIDLSVGIERQD